MKASLFTHKLYHRPLKIINATINTLLLKETLQLGLNRIKIIWFAYVIISQ